MKKRTVLLLMVMFLIIITIFAESTAITTNYRERNVNVQIETLENGDVKLTWDEVLGAVTYKIYSALTPDSGNYALLIELDPSHLSHQLTPDSERKFYHMTYTFTSSGGTVTDIDGNIYQTLVIGNQEWMVENLKVTHYRNGDAIPTGLSNADWSNTTDGAYAIYPHGSIDGLNTEPEVVEAYGALYNWYAVDDLRGLAPEGWRVPTDDEWTELVNHVVAQGYPNESNNPNGAGNAMKSCHQVDHPDGGDCATSEHPRWNSHSTHSGFDEFGFSALPSGTRDGLGTYENLGVTIYLWSSAGDSIFSTVWYRGIFSYSGHVSRNGTNYGKGMGFSVRCVRDLE